MTRIAELLDKGKTYSFEFFPPKTDAEQAPLVATLRDLEPLGPSFVSVTYRGGAESRRRTVDLVTGMLRTTNLVPMAHLICVAHTRLELAEILVELGRAIGGFSIGVAAQPTGHPLSADLPSDRDHLAAKLAMADFAVTQFFFEASDYTALVSDLADRGVTKPVLPGIMPVTSLTSVPRMARMGAALPVWMVDRLEAADARGGAESVRREGVACATELCQELLEAGVPGLHFYTLNRSSATREIYSALA